MLKHWRRFRWSPPRILAAGFAVIIFLGAVLLSMPFASRDGSGTPFIDSLFTATSATCVTGLISVDTGSHYSTIGHLIIIFLIQIGGLGFMTVATLFAFMLRKKISFKERLVLQEAMNQGSIEGIVRLVRKVLLYSLTIEAVGAVLFTIRWSFDMPLAKAIFFGCWHAISMFNNAGFDLFGQFGTPFVSFTAYTSDPLVNLVTMGLIILGGLGFIVLSDIIEYRVKRKLSLHSKIVLTMTAALILIGAIVTYCFEFSNPHTLGALSWDGKIWAAFFQSVSPRTAGANTVDLSSLRQATQFFMVVLMFIGASPGSTGGGIKTTTFATLIGAVITMIRGREDIVMFKMRLGRERILKALTITMLALALVIVVTMLLTVTEDKPFLHLLFETTSAFGTVGLSLGVSPELTLLGKVLVCLTMFAGRLGPLTLAYALGSTTDKELYRYPEGKITIG
ncbi:TrkH family potassium uptake protein [Paenibacillus sp. GCM10027626]|uniref:TrkH family potassium uptake protein n=1 Tax=Paenibacillus sp. GCM10027626 TaxID=3273411 RepID=UPI003635BB17